MILSPAQDAAAEKPGGQRTGLRRIGVLASKPSGST